MACGSRGGTGLGELEGWVHPDADGTRLLVDVPVVCLLKDVEGTCAARTDEALGVGDQAFHTQRLVGNGGSLRSERERERGHQRRLKTSVKFLLRVM